MIDDPEFTVDLVIPHPLEMRALAEQHYLFCDHSHHFFDSFRAAWYPFGVAADGASVPLWVVRADDDTDKLVYEFHDDMWDPTATSAPGNGAFSVGLDLESVLTRASIIEHVTSDPFAPKASDLRFEPAAPPITSLNQLTPTPN